MHSCMVSHIDFTARGGTLHASGASREVRFALKGINWFGAEGKGAVVDGLWARPLGSYLDEIARLGFNAIRLPLAVDNVLDNPEVDRWSLTADDRLRGLRSLDIVERLVAEASARGLLVLLDMHRLRAAVWPDPRGLWYEADEGRPLEHGRPRAFRLRAAWRLLAHRFCSHWNVVGADLFNEPWGATWGSGRADTDWAAAAEALGDEVRAFAPLLLCRPRSPRSRPGPPLSVLGSSSPILLTRATGSRRVRPLAHLHRGRRGWQGGGQQGGGKQGNEWAL